MTTITKGAALKYRERDIERARKRRARVLKQIRAGNTEAQIALKMKCSRQLVSKLKAQALKDEATALNGAQP